MNTNFIKKRALMMSNQTVVSKTINKVKPVSKGGTKLVSLLDLQIAAIEMSNNINKTISALNTKESKIWRANI